ncbi:MAG: hypothetical protein OXE41_10465 [Gammaproteobacteria bacterium]|nr:hypothetical protein [Gammaproteobacteria bacterium]
MRAGNKKDNTKHPKDRIDQLLDEPVANPRYGGLTMREIVRKGLLRKEDPVPQPERRNGKIERK